MSKILGIKDLVSAVSKDPKTASLPDNLSYSLPIPTWHTPVIGKRRLEFAILAYFKRGRPPQPPQLSAPKYRIDASASDGSVIAIAPASSAQFGSNHDDSLPIGIHRLDPPLPVDQYLNRMALLYESYNAVLGAYAGSSDDVTPNAIANARSFQQFYHSLLEKPLLPYMNYLNPQFFLWVQSIAERRTTIH